MSSGYATSSEQFPYDVSQAAVMYQLGAPTAIFKPRFTSAFAIIGMVVGAVVLDIIALIVTVAFTGRLFYILLAIPILAIVWAVNALRYCHISVYLFAGGFVHVKGRVVDPVRWDQIKAVRHKVTNVRGRLISTYTLQRSDGKTFQYSRPLQNVEKLGEIIQQEVTRIQLPQVLAAFNTGQLLNFGKVNVDRQGINNGKEMIPWSQVDSLTTQQDHLVAKKDGRLLQWRSVKMGDVVNLGVLLGLVNTITRGHEQSSPAAYW
jgi:hypothetical protein